MPFQERTFSFEFDALLVETDLTQRCGTAQKHDPCGGKGRLLPGALQHGVRETETSGYN
jgi:hypothetical protein